MSAEFNIESRWPELFEQLDVTQRKVVVNVFASNRENVENLTDPMRGAIDEAEYDRGAMGAVDRSRILAAAG